MATTKDKRTAKSNGKQWDGDPDYGQAFHRPENKAPQPAYTGQGVFNKATLKAIYEAGGEFQIACWTRRAKSGLKYVSVHIEPPYQKDDEADDFFDDDNTEEDQEDDGDDIPF